MRTISQVPPDVKPEYTEDGFNPQGMARIVKLHNQARVPPKLPSPPVPRALGVAITTTVAPIAVSAAPTPARAPPVAKRRRKN